VTETERKSVRMWAVETGVAIRTAQRKAQAYQEEFGDLTETVNGYKVTRAQWEKITKR